jgi:glutamate/tyrosine decarboxylase-like PLP-dependent enzyme
VVDFGQGLAVSGSGPGGFVCAGDTALNPSDRKLNDYLVEFKRQHGIDVPMHVDGASGGFVWPFLYPHSE